MLRTGDFKTIYAVDRVWVFSRKLDNDVAYVGFNTAAEIARITIDKGASESFEVRVVWPAEGCQIIEQSPADVTIELGPQTGCVLMS